MFQNIFTDEGDAAAPTYLRLPIRRSITGGVIMFTTMPPQLLSGHRWSAPYYQSSAPQLRAGGDRYLSELLPALFPYSPASPT